MTEREYKNIARLKAAIIYQAVKDLESAYIEQHEFIGGHRCYDEPLLVWCIESERISNKIAKCEDFFRGEWFRKLSDMNGEKIIEKTQKLAWDRYVDIVIRREKRKDDKSSQSEN